MFKRLQEVLKQQQIAAMLVSDGYNMRYLSGFRGATGYLYISKQRQVLLTDSRYTTQASAEAADYEIKEVGNGQGYAEVLLTLLKEEGIVRLGFEDTHIIYGELRKLQETCGDVEWLPLGESLNRLRMVKTAAELDCLRRAEAIGDKAFSYILEHIRPGVTELQIAAKLDYFMKEQGAAGNSFDTIVASGIHSALPHAIPSQKEIRKGDFVTLDFGCVFCGYCSDMTRTVMVGTAKAKQREIYETVLNAQLAALAVIKPGLTGFEVDKIAREVITEAGYGAYFGHGLGHSVGLFIHENPRLSPKDQERLQANVVYTVEPGIYLPGFGGVRIEDMVVVTENGYENFTHSPKALIEL